MILRTRHQAAFRRCSNLRCIIPDMLNTVTAHSAAFVDLDAALLLAEDRDETMYCDANGIHPPKVVLWG
jgi:hypothetical protein